MIAVGPRFGGAGRLSHRPRPGPSESGGYVGLLSVHFLAALLLAHAFLMRLTVVPLVLFLVEMVAVALLRGVVAAVTEVELGMRHGDGRKRCRVSGGGWARNERSCKQQGKNTDVAHDAS